ncbi:MAG: NusG domain II-containing protein [Lachnospiraceae bacterium]|nr:NusG domain II-containing protein [Lachnospiraceae bacterium]
MAAVMTAAAIIWILMRVFSGEASTVEVSVDGEVIGEYPIDEQREIDITGAEGGTNLLVIKEGRADIRQADCPDKLCVHQAPISREGETLVCLPHRVVVTVRSKRKAEYDALTR